MYVHMQLHIKKQRVGFMGVILHKHYNKLLASTLKRCMKMGEAKEVVWNVCM